MSSTTTFILRLVAVVSVVLAAVLDVSWAGAAPIAIVALYSGLAVREANITPGLLEARAEEVYFLGYLSTLASFAGILLMLVRAGQLSGNLIDLLPMVVVALLATVAGLFGMATLHDIATTRKREAGGLVTSWEHSVLSTLERLVELLSVAPVETDSSTPGAAGRALTDASMKTAQVIQVLNQELDDLKGRFGALTTEMNVNVGSAKAYAASMKEVDQTLKMFVSLVTARLGEFRTAERV